ncbi:hypothetical protein ACFQ0M_35870 [Kitasatospora aburaviensis]
MDDEPIVRWYWIGDHLGYLGGLLADHAVLALLPVLIGLLLAVPLGLACARFPGSTSRSPPSSTSSTRCRRWPSSCCSSPTPGWPPRPP